MKASNNDCESFIKSIKNNKLNDFNLFITQPECEGVAADEFIDNIAYTVYEINDKRRRFEQTYIKAKFPDKRRGINEINYFFDYPIRVAQYYNEFKGVFAIDISHYLNDFDSVEFNMLLEYIESNKEDVNYIIMLSSNSQYKIDIAKNLLSKIISFKYMNIGFPSIFKIMDYMKEYFSNNNIYINEYNYERLKNIIEEALNMESFQGYKTIDTLLYKFKEEYLSDNGEFNIDGINQENMIKTIIKNSNNQTKLNQIGFLGRC